ncbi:hypothetical protein ACHAXN_003406 [Cyclotella atomus]
MLCVTVIPLESDDCEKCRISSGQDFNPAIPNSLNISGLKCRCPSLLSISFAINDSGVNTASPFSSSASASPRLPLQGNKVPASHFKDRLSNSPIAFRIVSSSLLAVSIVYEKLTM